RYFFSDDALTFARRSAMLIGNGEPAAATNALSTGRFILATIGSGVPANSASRPISGFNEHRTGIFVINRRIHELLWSHQVIASVRFCNTLLGKSGSASSWRPSMMASAWP